MARSPAIRFIPSKRRKVDGSNLAYQAYARSSKRQLMKRRELLFVNTKFILHPSHMSVSGHNSSDSSVSKTEVPDFSSIPNSILV